MPLNFEELEIPGVFKVQPAVYEDDRGYFKETFRASQFIEAGLPPMVQSNVSWSRRNVLRGMHYQVDPDAQGKLVGAALGEVYDAIVDVRPDSPTFGRWLSIVLSASNHTMIYVPPGFGHGFCVLSDEALVSYNTTAEFAPQSERGVLWNDPAIGIEWPVKEPVISVKDRALPLLSSLVAK